LRLAALGNPQSEILKKMSENEMKTSDQIARLPQPIREQINRRLQNGQAVNEIADWLNTSTEVKAVLEANFEAQEVDESDVASWQCGRYRVWAAQQDALEAACQAGADAAELSQAAGGQLADHLALCLTARIAVALRQPPDGGNDPAGQLRWLSQLCADLVALRKGDHSAQWLRIEREKLDAQLKKFQEKEAARKSEIEKPNIDFKNYHASKETHQQVQEMLKRL
jgi:hypothetical protein